MGVISEILESLSNLSIEDLMKDRPVLTPEEQEREKAKLKAIENALISLDFHKDEIIDEYKKKITEAEDALKKAIADRKNNLDNGTNNTPIDTQIKSAVDNFLKLAGQGFLANQGVIPNTFTKILPSKSPDKKYSPVPDKMNDTIARIKKITENGEFTLTLLNFNNAAKINNVVEIRTSTHQLLSILTGVATANNFKSKTVTLPLEVFMKIRGITDEKEARKRINEDLDALFYAAISFKGIDFNEGKRKQVDYYDIHLIQERGISKGIIQIKFGDMYFEILKEYRPAYYPQSLVKINSKKNPHSYYLGTKIAEMKNMNIDEDNEDIIAVQTLLDACPSMPTYEDVKKTKNSYMKKIFEPLERDLTYFEEEKDFSHVYCHANEVPLTDDELNNMTWEIFQTLRVKIIWYYYPDQTARIERKRARLKALEASKKKKAKSKPKPPIALP